MGYSLIAVSTTGETLEEDGPAYSCNVWMMATLRAIMRAAECFPDPDEEPGWTLDGALEAHPGGEDPSDDAYDDTTWRAIMAGAPLLEKFSWNEGAWVTPAQSARIAAALRRWVDENGEWLEVSTSWRVCSRNDAGLPTQLSLGPTTRLPMSLSESEPGIRDLIEEFIAFCALCGDPAKYDGFEVW